jgi:hypothetical protein
MSACYHLALGTVREANDVQARQRIVEERNRSPFSCTAFCKHSSFLPFSLARGVSILH